MYDYYILEDGENLDSICNLLHLNKVELMRLNSITDEKDVQRGTQLKVPVADTNYFNMYTIVKGDTIFMGNMRKT